MHGIILLPSEQPSGAQVSSSVGTNTANEPVEKFRDEIL